MTFSEKYEEYLSRFESYLHTFTDSLTLDDYSLVEAMKYSLLAGGKRIRPVLLLASSELLGVSQDDALPFALATECVHTYSLIHDDLPSMDNDDFRRGKPTNHKVYGESMAILAGDGLLNLAYELCLREAAKGERFAKAGYALALRAGYSGMVAGQAADIECENKKLVSESALQYIHTNKTARLIEAPLLISSELSGGKYYDELEAYGRNLGLMFQLTDDLLDVLGSSENMGKTLGKDEESGKLTAVAIYGVEGTKRKITECESLCLSALDKVRKDTDFLVEFVSFISGRKK